MDQFDSMQQKPYSYSRELALVSSRGTIVGRLRQISVYIFVSIGVLALQACSGLGFQGGAIPTGFTGLDSAQAISPQTITLKWTSYPLASKYNVYVPTQNDPIATPNFNQYNYKPIPADPTVTYQFSVTAVDPTTGKEEGYRASYTSVQLLNHFDYKNTGTATATSKNTIRVNWNGNPNVSYQVYVAERLPTGVVNYNSFIASTQTVTGVSSTVISNLSDGHEYCAVVVAAYADQTNDTPDGTLFTGDVGAKLNTPTYLVGPSGNFGDSVIAQSQKCARTQSDFSVANLRIYAQKASLSSQPVFYVNVPGDTTEDSTGTVSTSIYQVNQVSGLSTLVGTRIGTGKIAAQTAIASGRYKFFAVVSDLASPAQAQVEISVGPNGSQPASPSARNWIYVRSFNATETTASTTGYYPEKQQAGYGSQREGTSIAVGDFNCDGRADIAIGIPEASTMASDNRPAKSGKVVIYFDTSSSTPSATARTQTITFDITKDAGDAARDLRLGTSLYAANFNNDTQATNQYGGSGLSYVFHCDDLVIGSGYGPMFVLYGKRNVVGNDGGLNYAGPISYIPNPSSSCDPASNICQVAMYTQGTNYNYPIGLKLTSGDYNGDGYEDLAATTQSNNGASQPLGVWVLRGSEYGLISPTAYSASGEVVATSSGPHVSFPYLPGDATAYAAPTPAPGWGLYGFGSSIGTLRNAYYDTDTATKTKGTKRIRDALVIGNPSFGTGGQAHVCLAKTDYTVTTGLGTIGSTNDVNNYLSWDCSGTIAGPAGASFFGAAMASLNNPLRYRPDQFTDTNCPEGFANCSITSTNLGYPGGLVISGGGYSGVYVYYDVNNPTPYAVASPTTAANRDIMGVNRNTNLSKMLLNQRFDGTPLTITTTSPCVASANSEYCNIQQIVHPTNAVGAFGAVLNVVPGNVVKSVSQAKDSILAVVAPYRNTPLSNGTTYASTGSVQLYLQNSHFDTDPIVVRASTTSSTACDNSGVCRYADGFANSLTTSLDYDATLADNINFGLGGVAGGPLQAPTSDYNSNSDIVIGVPGHVAHVTIGSSTQSIVDNGAAMTFFSYAGVYRSYEPTDTGTTASPWHILDQAFSQESDLKFHQAIGIGDINQDGIDDVAVRINQGSQNYIRIYNGQNNSVGVNNATGSFTTMQVQGDTSAGMRFVPLGKITTGVLPAFFVTGTKQSYLFFDGIGGLVGGFPTATGTGGTPRRLYAPTLYAPSGSFAGSISYMSFADRDLYNSETLGNLDSTLKSYTNFAHGDFNGDGYEDFAIGFNNPDSIADLTSAKGCMDGAVPNLCGNSGTGRVMIFYGGSDNGFQTQPDSRGGYPLSSAYFTDYSADQTTPLHTYFGAPCAPDGTGCKIQMIHETATSAFGQSLTSVPAGNCTNTVTGMQYPVSSLVVSATKTGAPSVYVYRPKCLDSAFPNNFSGLVSYSENSALASTLPIPPGSSSSFGVSMIAVKNLMGSAPANPARTDLVAHLAIADQANSRLVVYPVHSINNSDKSIFESYTVSADGGRYIDYSTSSMLNGTNGTAAGFGNGLSALGDVNGDGFNDIGVGISALARKDTSSQTPNQGSVLVLFGGTTGLQSHTSNTYLTAIEPARVATCYIAPVAGTTTSTCNPTLLYLPEPTNSIRNGAYEKTFLSPFAQLSTSATANESLGTFLIGVPGRDSLDTVPTSRILQGGAFYVLP